MLNSSGEPPLVEHKTFKKKHKSEKKKSKKKEKEQEREQDLLGLDEDEKEEEIEQPGKGLVKLSQILCSDENLQVSYSPSECKITNGACSVPLTITNLGDEKCKELNLTLTDEYSLTKSLKPGEEKTKTVLVPVEGEMTLSIPAILEYRLKKERKLEFSLTLPASAWLTGAATDTEQMAELLMSGQLAFMLSASIHGEYSIKV